MNTPAKMIIIFILLWVAVHLLLYGYVKRRIAAAKQAHDEKCQMLKRLDE
jgi:hypothetical protein